LDRKKIDHGKSGRETLGTSRVWRFSRGRYYAEDNPCGQKRHYLNGRHLFDLFDIAVKNMSANHIEDRRVHRNAPNHGLGVLAYGISGKHGKYLVFWESVTMILEHYPTMISSANVLGQ
jgi:hypothetical protein